MTTQLCQKFQASQAVHVADDIMTTLLEPGKFSQHCGPQVETLIY